MAKTIPERKGPSALGVDAELARRLLHDMLLIRRFEEKAAEAYALGKVGGFLHLYIGEEAVAVGATSVLRRSEEHTSELQSLAYLVCRLLLEKKKKKENHNEHYDIISADFASATHNKERAGVHGD